MIIRPAELADAAGIAKAHVDTWRTTYVGIVSDERLATLSYEQSEQRQRKHLLDATEAHFYYVAEDDDGRIVGFAVGGPERGGDATHKGEINGMYILASHQRRGIGRRLVAAAATHLLAHDIESMLIWVLADNPSRRFYEVLGGRLVKETEIEIGGEMLVEVAYGWQDIRSLATMCDES